VGAQPVARTSAEDHESRVVADFCRHYELDFRDLGLVKLALTHRSYLHVTGQRDSNERLEFLGDSVLGLVTSEYLYRTHPNEHEGQLTKTKSLLVSKAILSRRALAMGLGRFVLMSHSEVESGGRQRLSILADAFESVVGAVYLDQGFEAARAFIERWLLRDTRAIVADKRHTNYKSHLQEYVQSTFRTHPVYRIRSEMGPDHSKQFMVEVIVGKRTLGEGKGRNKKEAEQAAARNALERVGRSGGETHPPRAEAPERPAKAERPPRGERVPRPAPVLEEPEDEAEESVTLPGPGSEEREVLSTRRRRRGRRGGKGRRRNGEANHEESPEQTDVPEVTARPARLERPARPERSERPARPERPERSERPAASIAPGKPTRELAEETPAEIEPRPRPSEEDENEEVGRPEGPRGGFHADPYVWSAAPREPIPAATPPSVPLSRPGPVESAHHEAEESAEPFETDDGAVSHFEEDEPKPEATEPESAPRPAFGRRPGRSRR
jgi:ribonuclease-3